VRRRTLEISVFLAAIAAALVFAILTTAASEKRWTYTRHFAVDEAGRCGRHGRSHVAFDLFGPDLATSPVGSPRRVISGVTWCASDGLITEVDDIKTTLVPDHARLEPFATAPPAGRRVEASLQLVHAATPMPVGEFDGTPLWRGHASHLRYVWRVARGGCRGCRIVYTVDVAPTAVTVTARRAP
jgi:hypothetical protein